MKKQARRVLTRTPSVMDRHHRLPKSCGGTNHPSNISLVTVTKHKSWHNLFGNKNPDEIAEIINDVWICPHVMFLVIRRGGVK